MSDTSPPADPAPPGDDTRPSRPPVQAVAPSSPEVATPEEAPPEDSIGAGPGRTSPAAIAEARRWLAARDPVLAVADAQSPAFPWRRRQGGFSGLMKMIVEQQVSVASAAAIWRRVEAGLGEVTPTAVLARDPDTLRSFGLSAPKVRYALGLAEAVDQGRICFDALDRLDDADAVAALTHLKGVGRWTAETYLMFCHGRTDVFPAGDVALQEAHRVAAGLSDRHGEKTLYHCAEAWRPHRGVAAHLLWAYYAALKRGEAAAPKTVIPLSSNRPY